MGNIKKFNSDFFVATHMADCRQRLTAVAFMQMAQDMAMIGADGLGFGYDNLDKHHTAWVLSRMHIHFDSLPAWRTTVNLRTWHKGVNGPFFLRDFILRDANGMDCATATSSWVVLDLLERKMVRMEDLKDLIPQDGEAQEHAIETPAPKVVIPRNGTVLAEKTHKVSYSDVDFNGHTNNTKYVEWAMNMMEVAQLSEVAVKDIYMNYIQETRPDTEVSLRLVKAAEGAEDTRFVEISQDGKAVFTCKMVFDKAL